MNNPKGPQDPLPICIGRVRAPADDPGAREVRAHHWNYGSPTMNVDDFHMRNAVFLDALDAEGRDRADVTVSTIIRYAGDLDATRRDVEQFAEAGVDLAIISIPKSDDPLIVEPIARRARSPDLTPDCQDLWLCAGSRFDLPWSKQWTIRMAARTRVLVGSRSSLRSSSASA